MDKPLPRAINVSVSVQFRTYRKYLRERYDAAMTPEQLRQVDTNIQCLLAETARIGHHLEHPRLSAMDSPWFPWIAMPCAVALGVVLAVVLR